MVGRLITVDSILYSPEEKRSARQATGADAADMETAAAARAAEASRVPWLAVRAITDGPEDSLPLDFSACCDPLGNVQLAGLLPPLLRKPWALPTLVRLGIRSGRAARALGAFLAAFLEAGP